MSRIAKRYSKALFHLADEQGKQDQILEDLLRLRTVINESSELHAMLHNPLIQGEVKANLLQRLFVHDMDRLTIRFIELLCRKRRSAFIKEVIDQYEDFVLAYKGIIKSKVISAVKLTSAQLDRIKERIALLTGKSILLEHEIKEELIGGFIIKWRPASIRV